MKKIFFLAVAALGLMGMASCSSNSCDKNKACCDNDKDLIYTGVLPAADAAGVRYLLKLDYDDKSTERGDYDLLETYVDVDSAAVGGYKDLKTFKSEGDFTSMTKDGKTYLKLVADREDSDKGANTETTYFLVASDSTLVLVNADLEESTLPGMNYTLTLSK